MKGIVNIHHRKYSYNHMEQDLQEMARRYPKSAHLFSIGETTQHRQLHCLRIGPEGTDRTILVQASMHAREWLNTQLVMLMAERLLSRYHMDILWEGIPYRQLLRHYAVYVIPMMNPDGVEICQGGRKRYKANANGVDLNRNYETGFSQNAPNTGLTGNLPAGDAACDPGEHPGSEHETQALMKLVHEIQPDLVINYHSAGEEIIYQKYFNALRYMSDMTTYPLVHETGNPYGSFGDWLTEQDVAWCTLETGLGKAPVWHCQIYIQWIRHRDLLPLVLATIPQRRMG